MSARSGRGLKRRDAKPYPLESTCRVNGETRQHSNTEHMIFKVPRLIAEISRSMTLNPGDIVLTGTCAGGGVGSGNYLKPGDVVECEIERLGVLRNHVVVDRSGAKTPDRDDFRDPCLNTRAQRAKNGVIKCKSAYECWWRRSSSPFAAG